MRWCYLIGAAYYVKTRLPFPDSENAGETEVNDQKTARVLFGQRLRMTVLLSPIAVEFLV